MTVGDFMVITENLLNLQRALGPLHEAHYSNSLAVQKDLTFLPPAVMNRQFIRLSIIK